MYQMSPSGMELRKLCTSEWREHAYPDAESLSKVADGVDTF